MFTYYGNHEGFSAGSAEYLTGGLLRTQMKTSIANSSNDSIASMASSVNPSSDAMNFGMVPGDNDSTSKRQRQPSPQAAMYASIVAAGLAVPSPIGPTVTSTYSQNPNVPMKMKLRERQDAAQKDTPKYVNRAGSLHIYAKSNIRRWEPAGLGGNTKNHALGSYTSM